MKFPLLLFIVLCFATNVYSQVAPEINIDHASKFVGAEATICAVVSDTFKPAGDRKNIYINFGGVYPNHKFTVVIFSKDQDKFTYDIVSELKGKEICVSGEISIFNEKPQIIVRVPTQINIQN
jgi:hypothetical protein